MGARRLVPLTTVAQCYEVEITWLREVYDYGLLGERAPGGEPAIPTEMFERVATIRRLSVQQGVNLPGIALILELLEG